MIKGRSTRFAIFLAVALLATSVGYRVFVLEQSQHEVRPDSDLADQNLVPSDEDHSKSAEVNASQANRSPASVGPNGLHQKLLAMPEPYRNQILLMTLRDAGFKCDEVMTSQLLGIETGAWHAHCGGTLLYRITIGDFGRVSVDLIPHGGF